MGATIVGDVIIRLDNPVESLVQAISRRTLANDLHTFKTWHFCLEMLMHYFLFKTRDSLDEDYRRVREENDSLDIPDFEDDTIVGA